MLADEYGIVMGTSAPRAHDARAQRIYQRRKEVGPWDYANNRNASINSFAKVWNETKNLKTLSPLACVAMVIRPWVKVMMWRM